MAVMTASSIGCDKSKIEPARLHWLDAQLRLMVCDAFHDTLPRGVRHAWGTHGARASLTGKRKRKALGTSADQLAGAAASFVPRL
jgi:hypothetical protein